VTTATDVANKHYTYQSSQDSAGSVIYFAANFSQSQPGSSLCSQGLKLAVTVSSDDSGGGGDSGGAAAGAIAGGVIGGLVGAALIAGAIYYVIRRRKTRQIRMPKATAANERQSYGNPSFTYAVSAILIPSCVLLIECASLALTCAFLAFWNTEHLSF
jgi:hypothetical protein